MTGYETGIANSIENSLVNASQSGRLEVLSTNVSGNVLETELKVTNLTGHRFPSGVGFRRLFLEVLVRDGTGQVVWGSGRSNNLGVIVDENGVPLPSESHAPGQNGEETYEPHYRVVDAQNKAQIYGELIKNSEGKFNTTFLGRVEDVKDNRLMPKGWTFEGPPGMGEEFVETTNPVGGAANDPDFVDGTGSDRVLYRAALPPSSSGPYTVSAKLYYQAIPPVYLQDRFDQAKGPATRRLHYMASRLNTGETSFPGWKLSIAETTRVATP
jgi:hypothetical protein